MNHSSGQLGQRLLLSTPPHMPTRSPAERAASIELLSRFAAAPIRRKNRVSTRCDSKWCDSTRRDEVVAPLDASAAELLGRLAAVPIPRKPHRAEPTHERKSRKPKRPVSPKDPEHRRAQVRAAGARFRERQRAKKLEADRLVSATTKTKPKPTSPPESPVLEPHVPMNGKLRPEHAERLRQFREEQERERAAEPRYFRLHLREELRRIHRKLGRVLTDYELECVRNRVWIESLALAGRVDEHVIKSPKPPAVWVPPWG